MLRQVGDATREEDFTDAIERARELPRAERQQVVAEVVRREASEAVQKITTHRLQPYARHLPANPRTMKRFINAYEIARAVDRVEGRSVTPEQRAIWAVIRLRWPLLAHALEEEPDILDRLPVGEPVPGTPGPPEPEAHALLRRAEVLRVVDGFRADDVRACCGLAPEVRPDPGGESADPT